jgi:small subunit ribosomal protein S6
MILDTRGREETVDALVEGLKPEITAAGGSVASLTNHGQRDFARTTDRRRPNGVYVTFEVQAPTGFPAALREQLRLNKLVYRALVERSN